MPDTAQAQARAAIAAADRPFIGIGLVCLAMIALTGMDGISKQLTADFHPFMIAWSRYFFSCLFLLPFVLRDPGILRSKRMVLQGARGVFIVLTSLAFISSLAVLPIADATAIGFVGPFFVTALSVPLLGEKVGIRRWLAVVVGFIGIVILVRPGTSAFQPAAMLPVLAAVFWAAALIIGRMTQGSDSAMTTTIHTHFFGFLLITVLVVPFWHTPSLEAAITMSGAAAFSTIGQALVVVAFRFGPASLLAPFTYSQIIWATLFGLVFFDAFPDELAMVGTAIIIASGLYILHRENLAHRRAAAGR